ncbi:hypothetical protein [Plantactinospora endophytica]|uniref:Uncharacterized protein n=1 Tax=Plantactinospora endophytica TaxID=673535 RepID=A0ABQ4E3A3_9ACTN|nr:hypothetical protein [Plantactinospora endophytica]GIG89185.1 hypothetical protein Pen02_41210 [Plantactinospora endophytica]
MYGWIWRKLPFGVPGKLIGSLLITASLLAALWYVVFPWAEPLLPFDDVQVTQENGVPGDPAGGEPGVDGEDPGVGDTPAEEGHELPYDTERNNTPPPSPTR